MSISCHIHRPGGKQNADLRLYMNMNEIRYCHVQAADQHVSKVKRQQSGCQIQVQIVTRLPYFMWLHSFVSVFI